MSDVRFEYVESRRMFWMRGLLHHLANGRMKMGIGCEGYRLCAFPNDLIGREIAVSGIYEGAGIAAVRWLCAQGVIENEGGAFLDIGANVGVYTVSLASRFASVLAFEPHPLVHQVLALNVTANDLHNVSLFNFGLSDRHTSAELWEGTAGNVGASSVERRTGKGRHFMISLRHAATAVRDGTTVPIAFIKMDVEGHEPKVIAGLQSVLTEQLPAVAFEANDLVHNQAIMTQLRDIGYTTFLALNTGPALPFLWLRVAALTLVGVRTRLTTVSSLDGKQYSLVFALSPLASARWKTLGRS